MIAGGVQLRWFIDFSR